MAVAVITETDIRSAKLVADTLNEHNAGIETLRATARDNETLVSGISRRFEEMEKRVSKGADKAAFENGTLAPIRYGTVGDMAETMHEISSEYGKEDGSIRMTDETVKLAWGDDTVEFKRVGFLTDAHPKNHYQANIQRSFTAYVLARQLSTRDNASAAEGVRSMLNKARANLRMAFERFPGPIGRQLREQLQRELGTTSGSSWIVAQPSQTLIRPYELDRAVLAAVPKENVLTNTWTRFTMSGNKLMAGARGESDDRTAIVTPVRFTPGAGNVTIKDLAIMVDVMIAWLRDVAPQLADPAGMILDWLNRQVAASLEIGIIHGDTAATHQDTLAAWTINGWLTAGDASGATSILHKFEGLRKRATTLSSKNALGSFTAASAFASLSRLGSMGGGMNQVFVTGLATLYGMIMGNSSFLTFDKLGPMATLATGQMGTLAGRPLLISQFLGNEYAASGFYTGSGATGILLNMVPDAFRLYIREQGGFDVTYPDEDLRRIGLKFSGTFETVASTGDVPVSEDYNVTA